MSISPVQSRRRAGSLRTQHPTESPILQILWRRPERPQRGVRAPQRSIPPGRTLLQLRAGQASSKRRPWSGALSPERSAGADWTASASRSPSCSPTSRARWTWPEQSTRRSGGDHGPLLLASLRGRASASTARSTSSPATASWPCSARRSRTRTTPPGPAYAALQIGERVAELRRRAAPRPRPQPLGPDRPQLGRGGGRRRSAPTVQPAYTAIGHTVGLAQRMEALAEPGKAYLTEHAALATGTSSSHDLGEFEVKGVQPPCGSSSSAASGSARIATRPLARAAGSRDSSAGRRRWRSSRRRSTAHAGRRRRRRRRRRARHRQEPPVPRVRRALPGTRDRRLRGPAPCSRPGDPVAAGVADAARLLRDRGGRLRTGRSREGRRPAAAARSRLHGRPAAASSTSSPCPTRSARRRR